MSMLVTHEGLLDAVKVVQESFRDDGQTWLADAMDDNLMLGRPDVAFVLAVLRACINKGEVHMVVNAIVADACEGLSRKPRWLNGHVMKTGGMGQG